MRIRQRIVRAVNKIRGVDAWEFEQTRQKAKVSRSSLALYLGVSMVTIFDWEGEYIPIPKMNYESAMRYLNDRAEQADQAIKATAAGIRNKQ